MTTNNNAAFELVDFNIITQTFANGTSDNDYLEGTNDDNYLEGLEGYDTLDGKEGNDNLDGGTEDDTLYGGAGNDSLMGGDGNDYIDAGTGDDTVIGGYGDDLLYKDLSGESTSINFDYSDYYGEKIQEIEAVILYTGSGDDMIVSTVYDENGYYYDYYINEIASGDGNDSITTGYGNDSLSGGDGDDYLESRDGDDYIDTGTGDDTATGGLGNDILFRDESSATSNIIFSYTDQDGEGFDTLYGVVDSGNIREFERIILRTGSGNDKIIAYAASGFNDYGYANEIHSGSGHDTIVTGSGFDSLYGGDGNDYLYSGSGDDVIDPGSGNDTVDGGAGYDRIESDFSSSTDDLNFNSNIQGIEKFTLQTGSGDDTIVSTVPTNYYAINIDSGAGDDSITTGSGNDSLVGGDGDDTINAGVNSDSLYGGDGDDSLNGGDGDDYIEPGTGNDTVVGGVGFDELYSDRSTETGNINFSYTNFNSGNIQEIERITVKTGSGDDTILATASYSRVESGSGNDLITTGDLGDFLVGGEGNDTISAGGSDDNLYGGKGNDVLSGGDGNDGLSDNYLYDTDDKGDDFLDGGNGDDWFSLGRGNDTVVGGTGTDHLRINRSTETGNINFSYTDPTSGNIQGIEQIYIETGSGDDTIVSTAATFSDYNFYSQQHSANLILSNGGNDLITTGNGNDNIAAGDGNDTIYSGGGNDTFSGGNGDDFLNGGDGNDLIIPSISNDTVVGGEGTDTIFSDYRTETGNINFSHTDPNSGNIQGIEQVQMSTGSGNDTIVSTAITIGAYDRSNTYYANRISSNSGNDSITTGNGVDILDGGDGDDTLSSGSGNDTIYGGNGNDLFIGVNPLAIVPGQGEIDHIYTNNGNDSIILADESNIFYDDNSTISGGLSDYAKIYDFNPTVDRIQLQGSASHYRLDIFPSDAYLYIDKADHEPDEQIAYLTGNFSGLSLTSSAFTYVPPVLPTLPNLPVITLTVSPSHVAENGTANLIYTFTRTGNLSNPLTTNFTISGTASSNDYTQNGATITGSNGNITFAANSATASLTINPTGDTLLEPDETVTVTLLLGDSYTFGTIDPTTGTIVNDDGGNTDDLLVGGVGADSLNGKEGNDTMIGAAGKDTYFVDSVGDVITENPDEGTDTVNASISYTLGDHLENLNLLGSNNIKGTGNTLNNILNGNSGNNTLTGLDGNDKLNGVTGNDTLIGGTGNDSYTVDGGDTVTENTDGGTDGVSSSASYTLSDNLENLTLTGTANINGTGNDLNNNLIGNTGDNTLTGHGGNDTLNGKAGNDKLIGGLGDDTYTIDVGDSITENISEGMDTVKSSVTFSLVGTNLEHLILSGNASLDGTGNEFDNLLTGNNGNNSLTGKDGDDTLLGGKGNDTLVGGVGIDSLTGGSGQDSFVFDTLTEGIDKITDFRVIDDSFILSASGFGGELVVGDLATNQLRIGSAATTLDHRLIYNSSTGGLFFDIDGVGGTAAIQFATLGTKLALTSANFSVFV